LIPLYKLIQYLWHFVKIYYPKGISPQIKQIILVFKYQGWGGILLGTTFMVPGFLNTFLFNPIKEPIKTKGVEQHIHKINNVRIVVKGTAPDDSSMKRKKFIMKNVENAKDGNKKAVIRAFFNQSGSWNILYILADAYPANPPINTKINIIKVTNEPLLAGETNPKAAKRIEIESIINN